MNDIPQDTHHGKQAQHTPGPWSQSHRQSPHDGMYRTQVYDASGETIATCAWYPVETEYGTETNREANAALIVHAVNSHDALITFVKEFLAAAKDKTIVRSRDFESDDMAWLVKKARAALSAATRSEPTYRDAEARGGEAIVPEPFPSSSWHGG